MLILQSELVENAAAVQSMNSISDVYSEISDRNSMNAIIDDVEEHQFHNNSASSNSNRNSNSNIDQQVLLGHRIQTILQPCKVASNSMNSFNFSEVKGYAVFDDDDEDDDDSSEMDHGSYDGGIPNDEYEEYDGE